MTKKVTLNLGRIFTLFLLFLPFTQALTVNVGFPLKISELLLILLIIVSIAKVKVGKVNVKQGANNLIILFLVWATFSFLINLFWQYPYPLKEIPTRMGSLKLDSILRLLYVWLSVFAYFISQKYFKIFPKALGYWVTGAVIASVYAWHLFVFSSLNLPYIKLFGMDEVPQNINGVIRCGTFKEGNFFGLYLILSGVIALHLNRTKTATFLLISTITTLSTMTYVSVFVFLLFISRRVFLKKKVLKYALILSPFILISTAIFIQSSIFQERIYAKLAKPSNELSPSNFSKVDRVISARIAFYEGLDNPIFGVGPYNYALHYDEHNDFESFITNNTEFSLKYFKRENKRAIPNNVYLEVWSEYGIVGFLIFVSFLLLLLLKSFKARNDMLTGGVLALLVSFNAFPSFIVLFIWVFLALVNSRTSFNVNENEISVREK
ncbi:O-antigen ligase family protein [Flagellimonas zhangzhouensis]|uniref:O-antigen ligase n=1 Tax=Flagellimonas zhangzhouensis TaxID=1073328 RepID=A0A1H2USK7_9FLAO|nr:O-antigen ligase family protein [Allomuricauda zhangzhouensis]SDQ14622.1 O-antigen ligase [Allomuricauda zhangzhouensis]SDW58544.1 O-antigen ligase [Allomuricauda zhangzhouensis]